MKAFVRAVDSISRLCGLAAIGLLVSAVLVVCHMVFVRYVLGQSTVWQTEYVIYALVASTFIGSPYVLLLRGHVNVDLVPMALKGTGRKVIEAVNGLLSLLFAALLAYAGWISFHEAWEGNWTTATVWQLPLWIPLLPLPLGIGLLGLQYVAELVRLFVVPADDLVLAEQDRIFSETGTLP